MKIHDIALMAALAAAVFSSTSAIAKADDVEILANGGFEADDGWDWDACSSAAGDLDCL